jgi:hypothetical protein
MPIKRRRFLYYSGKFSFLIAFLWELLQYFPSVIHHQNNGSIKSFLPFLQNGIATGV